MPFVIGLGIGTCIVVATVAFVCAATNVPIRDLVRYLRGGLWY